MLNYLLQPETSASRNAALDVLGTQFFDSIHERKIQLPALETFHAEYWDLPLVARMAVTNDLIFTPSSSPETAKHITNRLLDKLMGGDSRQIEVSDLLTRDEHLKPFTSLLQKIRAEGGARVDYLEKYGRPEGETLQDSVKEIKRVHPENDPSTLDEARRKLGIAQDRSPQATAASLSMRISTL